MSKKNCKIKWKENGLIVSVIGMIFAGGIVYGQINSNTQKISEVKVDFNSKVNRVVEKVDKIMDYIITADKERCKHKGGSYAKKED